MEETGREAVQVAGVWSVHWIDLAQDRNRWQAVVSAVMNLAHQHLAAQVSQCVTDLQYVQLVQYRCCQELQIALCEFLRM